MPVLCLAGLTRNSADFDALAIYLSTHEKTPRRVLCLDYRGRGNSDYDQNWLNYNPLREADDVFEGVVAAGLSQVALVGTSRGGMIAMVLAATHPGLMRAVILNDIGPEVDATGLMRIKKYIENATAPENWSEAREAIAKIGSRHFPDWDEDELDRQARLIFKQENGKIIRRYDANLIKPMTSINFDQPLPTFWPQFEGLKNLPMLVIRGENSDLLSVETVEKMKLVHPGIKVIKAARQGHAPELGLGILPIKIAGFIAAVESNS